MTHRISGRKLTRVTFGDITGYVVHAEHECAYVLVDDESAVWIVPTKQLTNLSYPEANKQSRA